MTIFGIYWAQYAYLHYWYLLVPFFIVLIYRAIITHVRRKALVSDRYLYRVMPQHSMVRKSIKIILYGFGILFLCAAFLRPQWGKKEQIVSQEGRDLIIAIDVSRSMLAHDVKPNRLYFAKQKIKKLLYNLSCERVGLVIFSDSAVVQCPLTTDYAAFFLFLDQLDVDTISQGTTALDQAIKTSLQVFESIPTRKTKIVVAFTDGEDFSADLDGIKEQVIQQGLSIFTVGIGTTHGAPVPILNDQHKQIGWEKDDRGNVIMSRLDERLLIDMSMKSGGKYVHAAESDDDISTLITAINSFEKDALEDKTFESLQEQYPYCAAVSFICFALEWII